jgi:hypothetical protein
MASSLLLLLAIFAAVAAIPALIGLLVVVLTKREYSAIANKQISMAWKIGLAYLVAYMALFLVIELQLATESINRFYFPSYQPQPDSLSVAAHWLRAAIGIPIPLLVETIAAAASVHLSMHLVLLFHLANGAFLAYLAASTYIWVLKVKERRAKNHAA